MQGQQGKQPAEVQMGAEPRAGKVKCEYISHARGTCWQPSSSAVWRN